MINYGKLFIDMIKVAGEHNGIIYGDYADKINECFIQQQTHQGFDDLSIWFKSYVFLNEFIKNIKELSIIKLDQQYFVYHNHAFIIKLDLNISTQPKIDHGFLFKNDKMIKIKFTNIV